MKWKADVENIFDVTNILRYAVDTKKIPLNTIHEKSGISMIYLNQILNGEKNNVELKTFFSLLEACDMGLELAKK